MNLRNTYRRILINISLKKPRNYKKCQLATFILFNSYEKYIYLQTYLVSCLLLTNYRLQIPYQIILNTRATREGMTKSSLPIAHFFLQQNKAGILTEWSSLKIYQLQNKPSSYFVVPSQLHLPVTDSGANLQCKCVINDDKCPLRERSRLSTLL